MDEPPKRGLLAAYGRLLRPLIRILIRNGVSFSEFAEVAKGAYVEVAEKDFSVPNKKITQTRISALTGLERREVKELTSDDSRGRFDSKLNQIAGALFGWHTDSDFTGPYGVPLELQLSNPNKIDFEELTGRHVSDANPEELLKELVRIGAVIETERGWYRVLIRHFIPEPAAPEGLDHLSRSVEDFVTTLDHNRLESDPSRKLFERQVYTDEGIRAEDLEEFQRYATEKAQLLLEEIDNWLSQLEKPEEATGKKLSTGLGIYHYIHDEKKTSKS